MLRRCLTRITNPARRRAGSVASMPKIRLTVAGNQPLDADAFFARYGTVHSGLPLEIPAPVGIRMVQGSGYGDR